MDVRSYFSTKKYDIILISLFAFFTLISRYYFRSSSYDVYDITLYKYGVDTLIPAHPPGYPVFLLMARFLNLFTNNSLSSLIWVSIIFSIVFVIATYLIARILFNDIFIAVLSALLIMVNPTVWVYGIIGMSDMLQAGLVSIVVLFCAATLKYKKPYLFYLSILSFGLLLGVKINHVLLIPLIIYVGYQFRHNLNIILKSSMCLVFSMLLWMIPLYTFMYNPKLSQSSIALLLRDAGAFNILVDGPFAKITELYNYSAFSHFIKYDIPILIIFIIVIITFLYTYIVKNKNIKVNLSIYRSPTQIKKLLQKHNNFIFLSLWAIPYLVFVFLIIASRLRYYLPIYPMISISMVLLTSMMFNYLRKNVVTLKNRIITSIILNRFTVLFLITLLVVYSTIVSIYAISPYHDQIDTRSQSISFIKNLSMENANMGKNTTIFINSLWGGRMAYGHYLIVTGVENLSGVHIIEYTPLNYPFNQNLIPISENNLLKMLSNEVKNGKTDVYLVGDFVSPPGSIQNDGAVFKFKFLNEFSRQNEWIIDDPQGKISIYEYEELGVPVWNDILKNPDCNNSSYAQITINWLEDNNEYECLFMHAPVSGKKYVNFTYDVPSDANVTFDVMYGFVKGANLTDGVRFSVLADDHEVFSYIKQYNGNLSDYSYDLSQYKGKTVNLSLCVEPAGNNAYDWSIWVPYIKYYQ